MKRHLTDEDTQVTSIPLPSPGIREVQINSEMPLHMSWKGQHPERARQHRLGTAWSHRNALIAGGWVQNGAAAWEDSWATS